MRTRNLITLVLCAVFVLVAAVAGLVAGSTGVSAPDVWAVLTGGEPSVASASAIVQHVRVPRVEAALLAGAALAVSGTVIQTVLNNPLASPNIVGVNAGAGFAALLFACFFPGAAGLLPVAAFLGALAASLLILLLAGRMGASRLTVVLAGVAVNAILSAGTDLVTTLEPEATLGMSAFMVGGFSGVSATRVYTAAAYILPALLLALLTADRLDVLGLGDEVAQSVGLRVRRTRVGQLVLASVLAGAAISFSGLLGFVGLIVPHALRRLVGGENRTLLPLSMLGGALFVLICDTIARTVFAPYEVPVGILLALLGGPFFLWLLLHQRKGGRG